MLRKDLRLEAAAEEKINTDEEDLDCVAQPRREANKHKADG